ncbi:Mitochondrial import inner membrane translocase subunit Tim54 [Penicillium chermesinum]|nr:Mitochondrial import inner membrane translocase subunit Tim54 [Penicillium chermesinum]
MADSSGSAPSGATKPQAPRNHPNPVFKMMGLPNMRFKLPSRNWMIFLTITGSFAGAIWYDRREKRRAQQKWCELVSHLQDEPLPVEEMRRKLTVYLSAPPGDGLRTAREHFKAYVKPILTAAALDYTVVEGRREGDVRASSGGKHSEVQKKGCSAPEEEGVEAAILATRQHIGVRDEPGPKGDLVIGRHTWREYIRGLHEGWLGPMDAPAPPTEPTPEVVAEETLKDVASGDVPAEVQSNPDNSPQEKQDEAPKEDKKEEEKPAKPVGPTPAYISPVDYASAQLPRSIPQSFEASVPVEFPHILGFLNTPIRLYRYLNQRYVADSIGREVAALILANRTRPYRDGSSGADSQWTGADANLTPLGDDSASGFERSNFEQSAVLEEEEKDWHKSVYKREEGDERERVWLDDIVIDPRIASRMKLAVLDPEDEARSKRLAEEEEYILGRERPPPVSFWQNLWIKYGNGEDEETRRRKPIYGNIDEEDA